MAAQLTSADVPPEEAFHPKRSEQELTAVVESNADIIHDLQCGALSVEDPQGAEMLRRLDMMKFKEVLKRKFLKGLDPTRALWKLSIAPWSALTRPRSRTGSMRKRGRPTKLSSHLRLGSQAFGARSFRPSSNKELPPDGVEEAQCGFGLARCSR